MDVVVPYLYISRVETVVVVYNRAVIERQSHVRLVVAKEIIPRGLAYMKVFREKQCYPAPQHYLAFFESASCKNSDTSCLWNQGANLMWS